MSIRRMWKIGAICGLFLLIAAPLTQIAHSEEAGFGVGAEASNEAIKKYLDSLQNGIGAGMGAGGGNNSGTVADDTAARTTTLISPLPNNADAGNDLSSYLKAIFNYGIGLAALLALAQLIFGAVQYTTSAGAPSLQEDAKGRMRSAAVGLALLLISVLILSTIATITTTSVGEYVEDPAEIARSEEEALRQSVLEERRRAAAKADATTFKEDTISGALQRAAQAPDELPGYIVERFEKAFDPGYFVSRYGQQNAAEGMGLYQRALRESMTELQKTLPPDLYTQATSELDSQFYALFMSGLL